MLFLLFQILLDYNSTNKNDFSFRIMWNTKTVRFSLLHFKILLSCRLNTFWKHNFVYEFINVDDLNKTRDAHARRQRIISRAGMT